MNTQQNVMLKLATVRLAINHVLRNRVMQKEAFSPKLQRNTTVPTPRFLPKPIQGIINGKRLATGNLLDALAHTAYRVGDKSKSSFIRDASEKAETYLDNAAELMYPYVYQQPTFLPKR